MSQNLSEDINPEDSPLIKSDDLADLRTFFNAYPQLAIAFQIFQIKVIVDANVIIADLIWLTKTRSKAGARTFLQEVISAETLIAVAPQWLEDEIVENIPEVSEKEHISIKKLQGAWKEYRKLIQFEPVEVSPISFQNIVQDPDDRPYLVLQQKTGHPIYSQDSDLEKMGASLIDANVIATLKDYSRSEAIELTFIFGSVAVTSVGIAIISMAWNVLKSIFTTFSTFPNWVRYAVVVLLLIAIIHPKTRKWIIQFIKDSSKQISPVFNELIDVTAPIFEKYGQSINESDQKLTDLKNIIPGV